MSAVETSDQTETTSGVAPLELEDLHVAFGGNRVLEGVDLAFERGFNGLIGPNGAGKTTVFNVLSGYIQPTTGRVRLAGEDLSGMTQTGRVRAGIARTFQSPKLVLDATVMENTLLGRHHLFKHGHLAELLLLPAQRREETEARRVCMEMLDRFGLAQDAHRQTGDLSLGSQKIVEVCRALVAEPQVVLLDEPAAGLGADDVTVLLRGLRELVSERDLCLVIIEHDLELVTTLCPVISVLHFGRIISQGTPSHVTSDPVVIEAYLGHGFELAEEQDSPSEDADSPDTSRTQTNAGDSEDADSPDTSRTQTNAGDSEDADSPDTSRTQTNAGDSEDADSPDAGGQS